MYEDIKVTGVIGKPEIARSNRSYQMFFVNKRFIKDKTLQASAEQAFKGLLPIGKFGFLVLNLEMDPKKIDVNVHPTKLEIRFQEEQKVFKAVYHAIREGLLKGDLVKNTEKEQESPIEVNNPKPVQAITMEQTPVAVKTEVNEEKPTIDMGATQKFEPIIEEPKEEKSSKGTGLFGLFKKKEEIEKNVENNAIEEIFAYKNNGPYIPTEEKKTEEENIKSNLDFEKMYSQTFGVKKEEDNQDAEKVTEYKYADAKNLSVFEEKEEYKNVPAYTYRGAVFSTYLIIEMGNEMYIIDQHAAHERVLYEEIKKNYYQTAEKESQIMLLPDIINLSHKEKAIVKENVDLFKKAGFMIEEFGENAIRLIGVPSICMDMDTKELFLEILDTIDTVAITAKQEKEDRFIATIACKAAVKANMDLSKEEVDNLMKKLLVLPNPFTCPHGRPTAIKMSKIDLEKKFNRRK
jgi:DNA mismatch repair protein MutL